MKVYIYDRVEHITDQYHDSGGLVVVTDRDPLDVLNEHLGDMKGDDGEPLRRDSLPTPSNVIEAVSAAECVYVFQDAGCC